MYPDVYFEVPEKDRARVHLLHEDAPLWIEGEIEKVENNGLQIYLKVNKVLFDKDEPSHMQTSKLGGDTFNITQVHNGNGDQMIHSGKQAPRTPSKKWYEKPAGKLVLGVIVALIAAGIIYYLGWN